MMVRGRTVFTLLILTILITSSITIAFVKENIPVTNPEVIIPEIDDNTNKTEEIPDEIKKIIEVYNKIKVNYVEKKEGEALINGAILGMVSALNDPHSSYMDVEQAKGFFDTLSDSFEGIGAEVTMENGKVTVISPIKGSPSEKAGLQPRDQIIKVNGQSLEGLDLFEAVTKIRGPKNTEAVLEINRPGTEGSIIVTIIRDEIPIETVYSSTIPSKKGLLGKIEITNFGEKTATEFKNALAELEDKEIRGLILDLRGNPGGYLQSVLEISNQLIPKNGIIVQIEDRNGKKLPYKSLMEEEKYPIVTLINDGSASASEILAAALQESGNYPVIGQTSFGKGTVQNPFELSDGSNLKLTIAKWLTPNGNWIHQKGVQPDINVSQPEYYNALPFAKDVDLKIDMNNSNVKNLQIILNGLGYKTIRTDGYFDPNTESAVKAFQKANGLAVTGEVDPKTASLLQEQIIKRIKDPETDIQFQVALETLIKMIK